MDDDIRQRLASKHYAEAFDLVFARYRDKIFRLAFSMIRNEAQAQDVAQDVFVRIWKGLPGYHGSAALSTWVYSITRNTCLTELKKRSTRPTVSLQGPEMEAVADSLSLLQSTDPEPCMETDVAAMLSELPEKHRRVITLFYLEQKAYDEVAEMLGIPLGTVKTLLFRAKKELLRIASRGTRIMATEPKSPEHTPRQRATGPTVEEFTGLGIVPNLILL